jgi:hypothetical protein
MTRGISSAAPNCGRRWSGVSRALLAALALTLLTNPVVVHAADKLPEERRREQLLVSRIPHRPVESRALASVGYSKRLRALEIAFRRGGTYRYLDVPAAVFRDLLAAESKARFYNECVRGKYRSLHVRPQSR